VSTDPLAVTCPACLAAPGQGCYSTSADDPRPAPHRLRGLAVARNLRQCPACHGVGWLAGTAGVTAATVTGTVTAVAGAATGRVNRAWTWLRSRTWI
jgi:hypothetical protein